MSGSPSYNLKVEPSVPGKQFLGESIIQRMAALLGDESGEGPRRLQYFGDGPRNRVPHHVRWAAGARGGQWGRFKGDADKLYRAA